MRTQHHLAESTLLDYAAGILPDALSVVAASHLAWCRQCRRAAETAAAAPENAQDLSPQALPLDAGRRAQTVLKSRRRRAPAAELASPEIADFGLPMPLAALLDGRGLDEVGWRRVLPGVAVHELALPPEAPGQLRLIRILPGRALPDHGHGGCELSLVLRGAYRDQLGRYTIGDVADLDGTEVHRPVAEDGEACICLIAAEAPAQFRTLFGWLSQRFLGL